MMGKYLRPLITKFDRFILFWAYVSGVVLFVASMITFYDVVMRYVFKNPTIWALELSQYSLLLATFLGGAYALEQKSYVSVDIFTQRLPAKVQEKLETVSGVVTILTFLFFGWLCAKFTYTNFLKHWTTPTPLRVPIYLPLSLIPLGSFLIAFKQLSTEIAKLLPKREPVE